MTVFLLLGGRKEKENSRRATESKRIRILKSQRVTPEKHRSRKKQVLVYFTLTMLNVC